MLESFTHPTTVPCIICMCIAHHASALYQPRHATYAHLVPTHNCPVHQRHPVRMNSVLAEAEPLTSLAGPASQSSRLAHDQVNDSELKTRVWGAAPPSPLPPIAEQCISFWIPLTCRPLKLRHKHLKNLLDSLQHCSICQCHCAIPVSQSIVEAGPVFSCTAGIAATAFRFCSMQLRCCAGTETLHFGGAAPPKPPAAPRRNANPYGPCHQ